MIFFKVYPYYLTTVFQRAVIEYVMISRLVLQSLSYVQIYPCPSVRCIVYSAWQFQSAANYTRGQILQLPFESCLTYLPIFQLDYTGSEILDDRQRTYEKQF